MGSPPADQVRYHLHRALARREAPRYAEGFIHASEVTREDPEFCPREWALYDLTGKRPRERDSTAANQVVYAVGHLYQDLVTGWLGGMVVGDWTCCDCKSTHGFTKKPAFCQACRKVEVDFHYREVRFTSRISGASCGIDILVDLPGTTKLTVVEVKTEKQEEFKKLIMPRAEHRARTSFYLRIIEESGDIYKKVVDVRRARVLYVSKGGWGEKDPRILRWKIAGDGAWSPFKEFVVERDDAVVLPYHVQALRLHQYRQTGELPKGVCGTQFCQRAKGCPVVGPCFDPRTGK